MGIRTDLVGAVAVVTIDRPEAMNSLDPEHNAALTAAFDRIEHDDELRVAVLTGAGATSFCAGADLKTMIPPMRESAVRRRRGTAMGVGWDRPTATTRSR